MRQNPNPTSADCIGIRPLLRRTALGAGLCTLLTVAGCMDDVTPVNMNTNVAGSWQVQCQPVNEDCPNFMITFDSEGDITDTNIDGHRGPQRGRGQITGAEIVFVQGFGITYEYRGTLDAAGNVATGKMTNFDYDGEQKTTPATLTRK